MKTNQIKYVFLLLTFSALLAQPLQATIEKVKLQAGAINNASNLGNEILLPTNQNQFYARIPFVIGISHVVHLSGDWLDVCDRVEIVSTSGSVTTLNGSSLNKFKTNGKGQLKFTVPASKLSGIGNFTIRVRYLIETNGFDVLNSRVVARGVINSMQWVGTTLPAITAHSSGIGERSTLTRGLEYQLQLNGTGFGNSAKIDRYPPGGFSLGVSNVVVNSSGTVMTITMRPSTSNSETVTITPDLQDFALMGNNFQIVSGDLAGSAVLVYGPYLIYDFNNLLSAAGALTDLKEILITSPPPPPPAPNLKPLLPTSFGTTYKFGTLTVTDQQGKIYKNIVSPTTPDNNDLLTQLSTGSLINIPSRCVSNVLGNDPTLGVVTLHQITMGNYTCPITNQGNSNATIAFTNSFRGNMVTSTPQVLPTQAALARFTTFPTITTITQTLPSLNIGITNNSIVPKRMIQVFTFSNRPGAFYCDNAWPLEIGSTANSLISITVDTINNVNEGTTGGELDNVFPN